MKHEIETQWMGKMQFNALVNGHTIIMDAPERVGGEDHVGILRIANKQVDDFNMRVSGEISKQPPIEYVAIHIAYDFKGPAENRQSALDAVTISQEKYCGVSHMLKKILPLTWEVNYNGEQIFNNQRMEAATLN